MNLYKNLFFLLLIGLGIFVVLVAGLLNNTRINQRALIHENNQLKKDHDLAMRDSLLKIDKLIKDQGLPMSEDHLDDGTYFVRASFLYPLTQTTNCLTVMRAVITDTNGVQTLSSTNRFVETCRHLTSNTYYEADRYGLSSLILFTEIPNPIVAKGSEGMLP